MTFDARKHRAILEEYSTRKDALGMLAEGLAAEIDAHARRLHVYPMLVSGRAKSVESLSGKLVKVDGDGLPKYDRLDQITDLGGVRVVTHTLSEVELIAKAIEEKAIEEKFEIDREHSLDKRTELGNSEFGYLSRHLVLRFDPSHPRVVDASARAGQPLGETRVELQLRTMMQHAWADTNHDLGYKNEFQLPSKWERAFSRISAMLESADQELQGVKDALADFESSYSAFILEDELKALVERLRVLRTFDPGNASVAHRLVKAYLGLHGPDDPERWSDLEAMRESQVFATFAPGLRDLGVAYTRLYRNKEGCFDAGAKLVAAALEMAPEDVETLCCAGGVEKKRALQELSRLGLSGRRLIDPDELQRAREQFVASRKQYSKAHRLSSRTPYAAVNCITLDLVIGGQLGILDPYFAAIEGAKVRSEAQADAMVNLPWAHFDRGFFSLYQGRLSDALHYFARGVAYARAQGKRDNIWPPVTDVRLLRDLGPAIQGLDLVEMLLLVGLEDIKALETFEWSEGKFDLGPRVVILAGGCKGLTPENQADLAAIRQGLAAYSGTLVSGGTAGPTSGIAAIPGDIQAAGPAPGLVTVGYLPKIEASEEVRPHCGYSRLRYSSGDTFSEREPLAFWRDYLVGGGRPENVTLLGYNGGLISRFEFELALAMGAAVGLVEGSGRSADQVLQDPYWRKLADEAQRARGQSVSLSPIARSVDSIASFVSGPKTSVPVGTAQR